MITSDKIVFSIVSFLIVIILILPGVFIFVYAPRALHIVAFFCFAEGMLPILTWKKYFYRKIILSETTAAVLSGSKYQEYHISDIKAITTGMHTVFYFTNGKRYVIRYCQVSPKDILGVNPAWPCFKHNGDLRLRVYQNISAGTILLLFAFCFATGAELTYTLCVIAVITAANLVIFHVNYLFLD